MMSSLRARPGAYCTPSPSVQLEYCFNLYSAEALKKFLMHWSVVLILNKQEGFSKRFQQFDGKRRISKVITNQV